MQSDQRKLREVTCEPKTAPLSSQPLLSPPRTIHTNSTLHTQFHTKVLGQPHFFRMKMKLKSRQTTVSTTPTTASADITENRMTSIKNTSSLGIPSGYRGRWERRGKGGEGERRGEEGRGEGGEGRGKGEDREGEKRGRRGGEEEGRGGSAER